MDIQFVASVSIVVGDGQRARHLYERTLRLPLEDRDGYLMAETLGGIKHFGLWPLEDAAKSCFGSAHWPSDVDIPQASIEFEVSSPQEVQTAAMELGDAGYELLHESKEEPWGQIIARLLSPEGLIMGISYTPWFHS